MEGVPAWLTWIGSVAAGILSLFGLAKVVEITLKRVFARRDKRDALHESNAGKMIDADQAAVKLIYDRLETVEKRSDDQGLKIEALTSAHNLLMIENERLKTDAKHAEKELARQDDEIKSLRKRNHDLSNEIQQRDAKISKLEQKIDTLEKLVDQLTAKR